MSLVQKLHNTFFGIENPKGIVELKPTGRTDQNHINMCSKHFKQVKF
jgi:hypothetical protein